MKGLDRRARVARFLAPALFLAAATLAVLLIRSGLSEDGGERPRPRTQNAPTVSTSGPERKRPAARRARYYRVREGDTLEQVAVRFDTSVGRLRALNPGIDPTSLRIGQRVRVA